MHSAPVLLICTIRSVGHFTVYSGNFVDWALERGGEVVYLGHGFASSALYARFCNEPRVRFHELDAWLPDSGDGPLPTDDRELVDALFTEQGVSRQIAAIAAAQREFSPTHTLLVNSDDMLFHTNRFHRLSNLFLRPVYGISTFGYRDQYLGFADAYTCRLNRLSALQGNFAGMFTLDEYHVASRDPEQSFLHFLPDPYRAFQRIDVQSLSQAEQEQLAALEAFLSDDDRPIIPVLGKFDERKNGLWILDEVLRDTDLACVILGERVPSPLDDRIDAALDALRAQDRVFTRFDFTTEHFFDRVLHSGRVPCAPFPYRTHYGSSAVHLQTLEAGLPGVIPDVGLMARRCVDHDLGLLFRHGDRDSFRAAFRELCHAGQGVGQAGRRFLEHFSARALYESLDYAFGLSPSRPMLPCQVPSEPAGRTYAPPRWFAPMCAGQQAHDAGDFPAAMACFTQALARADGDHPGLLFRQALSAALAGDEARATSLLSRYHQSGNTDEQAFSLPLLLDSALFHARHHAWDMAWRLAAFSRLSAGDSTEMILCEAALHEEAGHLDIAIDRVTSVLISDALNLELLSWKSDLLIKANRLSEAINCLEYMLLLTPDDTDRLAQKISLLIEVSRFDEASRLLVSALELHPEDSALLHVRAVELQREGRHADVLALLDRVLAASHPGRAWHLRTRGGTLAALGRYAAAIADFQAALALEPEFHDVRLNLSDVLRYAGRHDEALDVLAELESLEPAWPQLHLKRGQVYFARGQAAAALAEYALERRLGVVSDLLERCEAQAQSA